jgi:hypothetical protein
MGKESSFRLCIAFLLIVQIGCWALTLLDLLHPAVGVYGYQGIDVLGLHRLNE